MLFCTAGSSNAPTMPSSVSHGSAMTAEGFIQVVLTVGILDMGQELCSFSHQMVPSPHEISRCPHLLRVDIGLGIMPPRQKSGDLLGIDLVVLCLASMDGFHIEGMAQDKGDTLFLAEIGNPVPGEHAFHGNDDIFPERGNGGKKAFRIRSSCSGALSPLPSHPGYRHTFSLRAGRFHSKICAVWCRIA